MTHMKQTYVFSRGAMTMGPGAKIDFMVVAFSAEQARELLKASLRRTVLNIGGFPVPMDISALWNGVEPASIGRARDDEPVGLVGITAEGLTSRDQTG